MTATERLRALLTERGVEWRGGLPTETMVEADGLRPALRRSARREGAGVHPQLPHPRAGHRRHAGARDVQHQRRRVRPVRRTHPGGMTATEELRRLLDELRRLADKEG